MSTKPFTASDHNSNSIVTIYGYSGTQFVVGLSGEAPYTSIQSAIDDAATLAGSSGTRQVVYLKSGFYKEDLIFKPRVAIVGTEVPNTLDNVPYLTADVSQNYGVFVQGAHTFEDSSGEFNVKNIIFFPKDSYTEDIIDFAAGDGCLGNTYSFENCKFFCDNTDLTARFFTCSSANSRYENISVFFKDCLFNIKNKGGDDHYHMFKLLGTSGTKYVFDGCTIKGVRTGGEATTILEVIEEGSGNVWNINFSNCKIDSVCLYMSGGTTEIDLSIDNCNLTSSNYYNELIQLAGSNYACRITNSYIYIDSYYSNHNVIIGDTPYIFDSTNTVFASDNGVASTGWIANISTWPNIANNSILSSGPIYCVYSDNANQPATSPHTAYAMRFNTLEEKYGISVLNDTQTTPQPTKISFQYPGVYNLQFSAQLDRVSGSGNADVNIWLRKNGETEAANIPRTDTKITMTGGASASKTVAAWNFMFTAGTGDYVQLVWSTTDHNIHIISAAADTTPGQERPAIPSVILTVYKIK